MQRPGRGTAASKWRENSAVECAARVQSDFVVTFPSTRACKVACDLGESCIGRREQNYIRGKNLGSDAGAWPSRADRAHGGSGVYFRTTHDGFNAPAKTMKALAERFAYASRSDDGDCAIHFRMVISPESSASGSAVTQEPRCA